MTVEQLDLRPRLESIRSAADRLLTSPPRSLDLLINNAGGSPTRLSRPAPAMDSSRVFGTNHLGHFALTGLLLPAMLEVPGSRASSPSAAPRTSADPGDLLRRPAEGTVLQLVADPTPESKLANLLFTHDCSVAWPGRARIARFRASGSLPERLPTTLPRLQRALFRVFETVFLQSAAMGALPSLRAATDPRVHGGEYHDGSAGRGTPRRFGARRSQRHGARRRDGQKALESLGTAHQDPVPRVTVDPGSRAPGLPCDSPGCQRHRPGESHEESEILVAAGSSPVHS